MRGCRMWVPPEVPDPILLHHPTRLVDAIQNIAKDSSAWLV